MVDTLEQTQNIPTHNLTPELEAQLKEAFTVLDQSGDGSIDAEELK